MNPQAKKRGGMMFGGMKAKVNNPQTRRGKLQMPNAKIRKYAEGGLTLAERERLYMDPTKLEDEESAARERNIMESIKDIPSLPSSEPKTRGEAFKAARAEGKKQFEWPPGSGKMYHTRTAEEEAARKPAAKKESGTAPSEFKRVGTTPGGQAIRQTVMPNQSAEDKKRKHSQLEARERALMESRKPAPAAPSASAMALKARHEALVKREKEAMRNRNRPTSENAEAKANRDAAASSAARAATVRKNTEAKFGGPSKYPQRMPYMGRGSRQATALDSSSKPYATTSMERELAGDPTLRLITGMARGGSVESKSMMKKEVAFMKAKGAPKSMIKHEEKEAKGMARGGMACGGMKKYARGGGVESHGKTKGTMIKMASGGSVSARADGVAQRGKTNCKIC
jgi:hypothetical protein